MLFQNHQTLMDASLLVSFQHCSVENLADAGSRLTVFKIFIHFGS